MIIELTDALALAVLVLDYSTHKVIEFEVLEVVHEGGEARQPPLLLKVVQDHRVLGVDHFA
jgi:hypothetical protein